MGRTLVLISASIAIWALAAAQQEPAKPVESPPAAAPKQENRISPEAKACLEAMAKSLYNPAAKGLRSLHGTMGTAGGAESESAVVDFQAKEGGPPHLVVSSGEKAPSGDEGTGGQEESFGGFLKQFLGRTLGTESILIEMAMENPGTSVEQVDGKKVLVLSNSIGGVATESRYELNEAGLPISGTGRESMGPTVLKVRAEFEYAKEGDRFLLTKVTKTYTDSPGLVVESSFSYMNVSGMKILSAIQFTAPMGGTITCRWRDLTVNGKKVDLPAAGG